MFDEARLAKKKAKTDEEQRRVIDAYLRDYPVSPPEELAWASDPTVKVLRRFEGAGPTPARYLDCQYRELMEETDVARWRLLGRDVRILDHAASEQARARRKAAGDDIVCTAQGFNLTEDQFYCRDGPAGQWPAPDAQTVADVEAIPDLDDLTALCQDLVAQGKDDEESLAAALAARLPQRFREAVAAGREKHKSKQIWRDPAWLRHTLFPPRDNSSVAPPCPPGYFQVLLCIRIVCVMRLLHSRLFGPAQISINNG